MRGLPAALLIVLLGAGAALAGAYDDFSRGVDANNRGNVDTAIAAFTGAIAAGDLAPPYLPSAFFGRARAYLQKRQCVLASSDLNEAIRLRSDYVDAYRLRASVNACLDRPAAALADASEAIGLKPAAGYYFARARLLWAQGDFARAEADAVRAADANPADLYFLLWMAVAGERTATFDRHDYLYRIGDLDSDAWPRPLLDLFAGRVAPEDVYRAAALGSGQNPANRKCEADFYVGEWHLVRKEAAAAKGLLQVAAAECPHYFIAFDDSEAELKRLR